MEPQRSRTPQDPPSSARRTVALALMVCIIAALAAIVFVRILVGVWT